MDQSRQSRRSRKGNGVQESSSAQDNYHKDPEPTSRNPYSASTIRAVTPESIPEDGIAKQPYSRDVRITSSSPPVSPRTIQRDSPRNANPRAFVARSNSNDGDYSLRGMRDSQTRPRTRTLEERTTRDKSPPNLFLTSRHRIGSVHSTGSANYHQGLEEAVVTSIGHPSTISPPAHSSSRSSNSSRNRLVKQLPRTSSPVPQTVTATTAQPDSWVSPVPASDARKVLKLMRYTCGRMQGMLAFRRGETNPWSLSYCYINEESGSLVYEPKSDNSYHRTLVPDLRGCRVKSAYDAESYTAFIHVCLHNSSLEVHLRPPTQEEFDSWFAALLCWQPIQPKGIQNKMAKPQTPIVSERRLIDSRRHSEVSLLKEAPIIKVGKMIYWDTNVSYSNTGPPKTPRPQVYRIQSFGSRRWRRVSCTLRENGELKLYSDTDVTLVSVVQLSQLSRCAVQRLDPSVLDNEFCIAIYPQYTSTSTSLSLLRPIFLSLESRVLYEVWIVLLRAFTIPQLYGPKQQSLNEEIGTSPTFGSSTQDMFRMERSLQIRVIEARLMPPISPKLVDSNIPTRPSSAIASQPGGYYIEILLDGETRARTMVKNEGTTPFWREEFEFLDLPAVLSTASLLLKKRPPSQTTRNERGVNHDPKPTSETFSAPESAGGYAGISFDQTCGKVDVYLDDLGPTQETEKWWPLVNMYGNSVGEVLVKVGVQEGVILMARDYQPMSELLHRFSNGLTLQLAQMVPNELKRLSECLLNIFQVSGQAGEWIMALVEEEIDGTLKETPASRLRFSRRLGSSDSNESFGSSSDRELFVRDLGNSAKLEANLLFRGNTLLTKALDFHMKRLGKEYLEDTLCEKLKEISDKDPDCEVDPNRIHSQHELDRNWRRLINLTEDLWKAIYNSVSRCPQELRIIFRHIRACAEDRYGDFLRTVTYSSVSGFLFLRFFCPAVLNPKLFGLLKAKSLQGLANMSTFGAKEQWMEPMNAFLSSHRQEFKTYIDNICSISPSSTVNPIPPSYSTPLAILQRLPPTSREGFPSLPYLIDHARNFAALVDLWLENTAASAQNIQQTDGDLLRFHTLCVSLHQRTSDCLNRAERAERPSSSLSIKWEELVEQLERSASFDLPPKPQRKGSVSVPASPATADDEFHSSSSTSTPVTMKAIQGPKSHSHQNSSVSAPSSSVVSSASAVASTATPGSSRYAPSIDNASTSASASASAAEETPPGSRDGLAMSTSAMGFTANPNTHINFGSIASARLASGTRSAGVRSLEGSEGAMSGTEEYTTALPRFGEREREREMRKEGRGIRGVLPGFKRKGREKGERGDKDKERDKREGMREDNGDENGNGNGNGAGAGKEIW
ncbi:hypothetical protein K432DRAFT_394159 [Lepidopterella palustris CBS 459.81]|uniref:Ras-GAP domain-containing protein n=1 Tax=Lepidopterella palustris CBS 459.81 TaxID=1314670 RepID=A0A8E2JDZ8_9PEZI|nr:hypothetical protein K432DRAFT_394159 [Lepidopterella palustris CBS 459.81]